MRVVYDYRIFADQRYGGISRYLVELANEVAVIPKTEVTLLAFGHINRHLSELRAPAHRVGVLLPDMPLIGRVAAPFDAVLTRFSLWRDVPDVVHETYYARHGLSAQRSKVVVTVHDMVHEKFRRGLPGDDRTAEVKLQSVRRADHVICVSHSTRRDLLELTDVDPRKVSVVHHGYTMDWPEGEMPPALPKRPYLLYVGQRDWYKNFDNLLKGFARSPGLRGHFALVCFGGKDFRPAERELMRGLALSEGDVVHVSGSNGALAVCYRGASALVYPSLYEGFGLPPLEAMSLGCPVVCSNTSSLPEVVGGAAELFEPSDADDIARAVSHVVSSPARAAALVEAGKLQVRQFSWAAAAHQTRAVYASLL